MTRIYPSSDENSGYFLKMLNRLIRREEVIDSRKITPEELQLREELLQILEEEVKKAKGEQDGNQQVQ
jgi:hypothetical protein